MSVQKNALRVELEMRRRLDVFTTVAVPTGADIQKNITMSIVLYAKKNIIILNPHQSK